jgi:hypothetical protein
MLIYNSTLSQLQYYNGSWQTLSFSSGAANWFSGSGAPSGGTGNNGDYYLNTANGAIYQKSSGAWSVIWNSTVSTGGATMTGTLVFANGVSTQLQFNTGSTNWGITALNTTPAQLDISQNGSLTAYFYGADFYLQSGKFVSSTGFGTTGSGIAIDAQGYVYLKNRTPSSTGDTGITGMTAYDGTYHYLCTSSNHWVRSAAYSTF